MKTLRALIIGFGLALASFGGLTDQVTDDSTNPTTDGPTNQITDDPTITTTDGSTNQITDDSTNQIASADSLEMHTYNVSAGTFVANLKYLLPPRFGESNTMLLIRFFKQRHIEIKPPESIFLNEKRNLLFAWVPQVDQDKIRHVVFEIIHTNRKKTNNDM
jgi:hypothetical protein